jgi:hypothetical protein
MLLKDKSLKILDWLLQLSLDGFKTKIIDVLKQFA